LFDGMTCTGSSVRSSDVNYRGGDTTLTHPFICSVSLRERVKDAAFVIVRSLGDLLAVELDHRWNFLAQKAAIGFSGSLLFRPRQANSTKGLVHK
jgi:hypothetical protein